MEETQGTVELIGTSSFQGELVLDILDDKAEPLPGTQLVGKAFQNNLAKVWEWLMEDEVSRIGIYGMGGVGKTTLVRHIYNLLLERQSTFSNIYWIKVSHNFNIRKMQDHIAKVIQFDLHSEDDEKMRAAKLYMALDKKQKCVLILDDLWNSFFLEEVGIPMSCKLIMTTRSLDIFMMMSCQKIMKLMPLLEEESWSLFVKNLGNYFTVASDVEGIAKAIVQECNGLPLEIVTLARSMRGVDDVMEWWSVLKQLEQQIFEPSETVFKVLNMIYDRLSDPALQECLLYCALFPENYAVSREQLIEYLISEDIIEDLNNIQTQFDRGHTMLDKLESACLLEGSPHNDYVKMHGLIRDMAITKMKKNPKAMVEAGEQLNEVPNVIEWSGDLVRVSLMENDIKEISWGHSPSCPHLSTLLLSRNPNLEFIADSFFLQFGGLKVLDLSETAIKVLPDSVSNLVSLTSLLLRFCQQLRDIPSLATLKTLKKLDLYGCTSLEVVPPGLEYLSNLQHLDMEATKIKDIPNGILQNLSHLQYFRINQNLEQDSTVGIAEYSSVSVNGCTRRAAKHMHNIEWLLLSTGLILEGTSAIFEQLEYALLGMVMAFLGLMLCLVELIYKARKERATFEWRGSLPWIYCQDPPQKLFGTTIEYFGLAAALWQLFHSTFGYLYSRKKSQNPIKMTIIMFLFCLFQLVGELVKKYSSVDPPRESDR